MKHMNSYLFEDNVYSIEGALSIESNINYTKPWRIDFSRKELFPDLNDDFQGGACSGVRICFTSNCTDLGIEIIETHQSDTGFHNTMMLDLIIDGKFIETLKINDGVKTYKFSKLNDNEKEIEIWLDQAFPVKYKRVFVNKNAAIKKTIVSKKRWVHYGSSISHSVRAKTPSNIWPGLVAIEKNLHLTNLGFGGNCILDPIIGNEISLLKADLFTLKLGINIHGGRLSDRSFEPCTIGLIESIRKEHKKTKIGIISPIYARDYENKKGASNLSLVDMRNILENLVKKYNKLGDNNIFYIDGRCILGVKGRKYMPDELHPNQEGQYVMAKNFIENIINKYI